MQVQLIREKDKLIPEVSLRIFVDECGSFADAIDKSSSTLLAIRLYLKHGYKQS